MDKKGMIGIVMCVVGLVIAVLAYTMPWYTIKIDNSTKTHQETKDYYFDNVQMKSTSNGNSSSITFDYSNATKTAGVQSNTKLLTTLGIVLAAVGIAISAIAGLRKLKGSIGGILIGLFALLIFVAPLLYMFTFPDALSADSKGNLPCKGFMSEQTNTSGSITVTTTCGPGNGWYFSFVSFVFVVIAGAAVIRIEPLRSPAPSFAQPAPQYAPQPQQYPPQQYPPQQYPQQQYPPQPPQQPGYPP